MLLDRMPKWFVYKSSFDYWYNWKKGYYYSSKDEKIPFDSYRVRKGEDWIMELVILKDWLNGQPVSEESDVPSDPCAIVTVPVPQWLTLIGIV